MKLFILTTLIIVNFTFSQASAKSIKDNSLETGSGEIDNAPSSIHSVPNNTKYVTIINQEPSSSFFSSFLKFIGICVILTVLCCCGCCSLELCGVITCFACFRPMLKQCLLCCGADEDELENYEFFNGVDNKISDSMKRMCSRL